MTILPEKHNPEKLGLYFLLAGPAGSGKTTLCNRIVSSWSPAIQRVVTATSRVPRKTEKEGIDYYFFSQEQFREKIQQGAFYEYAQVHGRYYGSLKNEIKGKLESGIDLIAAIDVQGVALMKEAEKQDSFLRGRLVTIFIMPKNMDQLRARLSNRGDDDDDEIKLRLQTAEREIECRKNYDYCMISDSRDHDFDSLKSIIRAEKMRIRGE